MILAWLIRAYRLNPWRPKCRCGPVSCSALMLGAARDYSLRDGLAMAWLAGTRCPAKDA